MYLIQRKFIFLTRLRKRPLYNFFLYLVLSFIVILASIFIFFGLIAPLEGLFFLLAAFFSFLVFYFFHKSLIPKSNKELEGLKEKVNILTSELDKKSKMAEYLPSKQEKASFLVELSQELAELNDPEEIFDFLLSATERLFANFSFISIFEFDRQKHILKLVRSLKKKEDITIKEKQGSGIERWMLRQNSSVLIGDIRDDFRFDANRIDGFTQRNSLSFLASPLSVGEHFFGIIRVESVQENSFSHEDLRLLNNISDLGAVVLERANLIQQVEELAITDSLTLLPLRNYFLEQVKTEFQRVNAAKKATLSLIMLDIDDFKKINDIHGHIVGDLVLKKLARILQQIEADPRIVACRYGGEEFMILLSDAGKEEAIKLAENIREKIEVATVAYRRNKVNFTVSIGLAFYPQNGKGLNELFDEVDKQMYKAKKEGKNKVCYLP